MENSNHDFTIVWLDANNVQPDSFFHRPSLLGSIISDLHSFVDPTECFQYLASISSNTLVFLLISGQFGENLMSEVQRQSKICYVYVYCADYERHKNWTKDYTKIRGIYTDRTTLLNQLTADVALYSKELSAPITLFKHDDLNKKERSIENVSKESAMFIWFQLLFETLLQSNPTMNERKDMLNECKKEYQDNTVELKKIEEFEQTYSPNEAIRWYTRDCFLYRLVNRAMRTQNIDFIYKYRLVIRDLHKQLCTLNTVTSDISRVYRGQLMQFEEVEQIRASINSLTSINTYFSTSIHFDIADGFSGGGLGRPNLESVIFTITMNENKTEKPFALIQNYSYIPQEGEVLFSAGTIFRIINTNERNDGVWLIELELSSAVQEQWHDVMLYLRTEIAERPTLITLGNFLLEMGDLDKSEHYYRLLMNELENEQDKGVILTALANIQYRKYDFTNALRYCTEGLQELEALPQIHPTLGISCNIIGTILFELNRLDDAMEFFERALHIHEQILTDDRSLIAADLQNMAMIDVKKHRFDIAFTRFQRALNIRLAVLPADHPLISHIYVNMGLMYAEQNDWINAHHYYDKAIALQCKILPATHYHLAISYANKAHAFVDQQLFQNALELYEQALHILLKKKPLCVNYLVTVYENIGLIHIRTGNAMQAIQFLEKALQYELVYNASSNYLCQLYNNVGTCYYKTGYYSSAVNQYEKALNCISLDDHSVEHFSTLNNIATAYFSMENYPVALDFYLKLMNTLNDIDALPCNVNFTSIYQNIGFCYQSIGNNDSALEYFARAFSLTENPSILNKIHFHIGETFLAKNDFYKAIDNYKFALEYDSSNTDFVIEVQNSLGQAYLLSDDINNAIDSYKKILNIQLEIQSDDQSVLINTYGSLANVYLQAGDFNTAKGYYIKTLELEIDENVKNRIAEIIEQIQDRLSMD